MLFCYNNERRESENVKKQGKTSEATEKVI